MTEGHLVERPSFTAHKGPVNVLAFTPNGQTLVTGGDDHLVRTWDATDAVPREKFVPKGAVGGLKAIAFAPDGKTLAVGGDDHVVRLWDLAATHPAGQPPAPMAEIVTGGGPGTGVQPRRQDARLRRRGVGWILAPSRAWPRRHLVPRVCPRRQDADIG